MRCLGIGLVVAAMLLAACGQKNRSASGGDESGSSMMAPAQMAPSDSMMAAAMTAPGKFSIDLAANTGIPECDQYIRLQKCIWQVAWLKTKPDAAAQKRIVATFRKNLPRWKKDPAQAKQSCKSTAAFARLSAWAKRCP